jgi:hypothetical protein
MERGLRIGRPDLELERLAGAFVRNGNGDVLCLWMPEQRHINAVASPAVELSNLVVGSCVHTNKTRPGRGM